MSSEVASPSFESLFGTSPQNDILGGGTDDTDLSVLADFNASFDAAAIGRNHDGSIDPRLTPSNPGSPANNPTAFLQNNNSTELDQTLALSPEPSFTYPDFASAPTSPYFPSVEPQQQQQTFQPSPLRNQYIASQHRRSVSEPPDAFLPHHNPHNQILHHHQRQRQQEEPPVIFHRDGHSLGKPTKKHPYPQALNSLPKAKHARVAGQAYVRPGLRNSGGGGQGRYELRRAQTQSQSQIGRSVGATSAPAGMMMQPPGPRYMMPPWQPTMHFEPVPGSTQQTDGTPQVLASPGPAQQQQAVLTSSAEGGSIDPMLTMSRPTLATQAGSAPKVVVMKLGVEELKAVIVEAVQKAVREMKGATVAGPGTNGGSVVDGLLSCDTCIDGDSAFPKASAMVEENGNGGKETVMAELVNGEAQLAGAERCSADQGDFAPSV